jgi:hypothetical protein
VPGVFLIDLDAHVGSLAAWRATSLAMEAQIVRARLAMRVEGRLKCAVNLVLPVISEISGGARPENSINGKFLELA